MKTKTSAPPCMDMYVNRTVTFFPDDKRRRIYYNIYAGFRFLEPVFQLNDLIALRNLLTEVIDDEQKTREIKAILNLRNKK